MKMSYIKELTYNVCRVQLNVSIGQNIFLKNVNKRYFKTNIFHVTQDVFIFLYLVQLVNPNIN